jgi:membrane associated rhomboid family serine protease
MFALGGAVQYLIIANLIGYLLEMTLPAGQWLRLALIPAEVVQEGTVWQIVTHMFLHAPFPNIFHILINMWILWTFGTPLERVWGFRRFMVFYFVTGIGAGVITVFMNLYVLPDLAYVPNIGASGAIYGLLVAAALLFPHQQIFIFPIPIPIPLRYAVLGLGALSLFYGLTGTLSGIGHFAHLGGMLVGFVLLKWKGWGTRPWI